MIKTHPAISKTRMRRAYRHAVKLLPESGDLTAFVARVAERRGRPIQVFSIPWTPGNPTGYWISRDGYDVIGHDTTAAPHQQAAALCHELSHMLLHHQGPVIEQPAEDHAIDHRGSPNDLGLASLLAPDLDPVKATRLLNRGADFTGDVEVQAEALGTALVAEALRRQARACLDTNPVSRRLR